MSLDLDVDDKYALRRVCERYFYALDHNDRAAMLSCFAGDCYYRVNVEPPMEVTGRRELEQAFAEPWNPRLFTSSNHTLSHQTLSVEGRTVTGVTYAVAHLVLPSSSPHPKILVRGLRYDDEYVKQDDMWYIGRRVHNPLWQYEVVSTTMGLA